MNGKISLDTNIIIKFFKGDRVIIDFVRNHSVLYLTIPVVAELLFAAKNSGRKEENLAKYREFINLCNVLPLTQRTAEMYSDIRLELKQMGRPIPENDLWIAAQCVENDFLLATGDSHFQNLPNLSIKFL